jgi:predicted nucleotidyltransferase
MIKNGFWENWTNKTQQEVEGIIALKKGLKFVLENVPKEEIVSICAKGSLVRREMKKDSDVDLFVVLKRKKFFKKMQALAYDLKKNSSPKINIGCPYTLWELKTGKKLKITGNVKPAPARIIKHLEHYRLLYGNKLSEFKFVQKDDMILLKNFIHTFDSYFLPMYEDKRITFPEIVKQVFWLVDLEQRARGNETAYSWKKLGESIDNKNHIIHITLKYRMKKPKDKKLREKYIEELKGYLRELDKLVCGY